MATKRKPNVDGEGSSKKVAHDKEWCEICECEIYNNPTALKQHFESESKHKRKEKLFIHRSFFASQGLDLIPGGTTYYCNICSIQLVNNADYLLQHLEKYKLEHQVHQVQQAQMKKHISLPQTNNVKEVFVTGAMKFVDFANTNDDLNNQLFAFEKVTSPVTVVERGPLPVQVFDLRGGVFTPDELKIVTKVASDLEKHGRNCSRSSAKGSSRITLWGMRATYGDIGWYVQDDHKYYSLSEDFANFVCGVLRRTYVDIFQHLDNIVRAEGFENDDAKIGGGPFTSFAVSRDFNCRPHLDEDDYGYGFILWLREDAVADEVIPNFFTFPQAGVLFVPKHGDVVCFRPGQYIHCTRRLQQANILGVAFFQKCSLYRQLGRLILPGGPGYIEFDDKKRGMKVVETREAFLKKKETYQQQVRDSTLRLSKFVE